MISARTNYNPDETTINSGNVAQLIVGYGRRLLGPTEPQSSSGPSVANRASLRWQQCCDWKQLFRIQRYLRWRACLVSEPGLPEHMFQCRNWCHCRNLGQRSGGGWRQFTQCCLLRPGRCFNGAQLWRNPINLGSSAFPWESPLIGPNGRAYLGMASRCDNPSVRGEIRSVNYLDGSAPLSQYFVGAGQTGGGIWNSPALSPDGSVLAVGTGENFSCSPCTYTRSMVTLDPNTLAILQSNQQGNSGQDQDWGTTPLFFHDATNRLMVGAHLKSSGFYAYVVSNVNGGPLWTRSTGVSVGMMDAYDPTFGSGGTLFLYGSSGTLYAVDPATGLDRWTPVTGAKRRTR